MLNDPEYRKVSLSQLHAEMSRRNPELAKALSLTSEQGEALLELLAQQQLEVGVTLLDTGDGEQGRQAAMQVMRDLSSTQQAALKAMLGQQGYQQYMEYQKTLPTRWQVEQIATTLATAGFPLTEEQREPMLASLVADERQAGSSVPSIPNTENRGTQSELNEQRLASIEERNRRTLAVAQTYLNPQQTAVLRGTLDRQLSLTRATLRIQRSEQDAGTP